MESYHKLDDHSLLVDLGKRLIFSLGDMIIEFGTHEFPRLV